MTDIFVALAPVDVVGSKCATGDFGAQLHLTPWSVPVQGIRVPKPASRTAQAAVATSAMRSGAANATKVANGSATKVANGEDATGDEAFEDPV